VPRSNPAEFDLGLGPGPPPGGHGAVCMGTIGPSLLCTYSDTEPVPIQRDYPIDVIHNWKAPGPSLTEGRWQAFKYVLLADTQICLGAES
jgi:hypothetical protein